MSVLSIRNLGKSYGATTALTGLDLDVAQGSRTAVVGPSGSGKTTLLRLIAGFETPDAGDIRLAGDVISNAQAGVPAHKRNIGLVMQEGALFPHLTVLDNIRFGITDQADSAARAYKLLDLVELDRSMAERQPHQLSGGQQQRVALARALARQPRLMLLDEPFSALDTGLRDQLRRATADILAAANVATLLVTHDRDEAMSFADQLVVLRDGKLIQAGAPRDVYLHPADATTAQFLGPAIILPADISDNIAHCALGVIPVDAPDFSGPADIMLRPEQLRITPASEPSAATWTITSAEHLGPTTCIAVRKGDASFACETTSITATALGSQIAVRVNGAGWVMRG
jgi:iron(III) transport system ATP-binding protein